MVFVVEGSIDFQLEESFPNGRVAPADHEPTLAGARGTSSRRTGEAPTREARVGWIGRRRNETGDPANGREPFRLVYNEQARKTTTKRL